MSRILLELMRDVLTDERHVTTTVDSSRSLEVLVDRPQMVRALANLLRNAELHGGGVTGVGIEVDDTHVHIVVRDAGPGVPAEERQRIFERFARAGGTREGTGSGLGLSIVAETVRRHGGAVWCVDADGGGAEFVVRLPLAAGQEVRP